MALPFYLRYSRPEDRHDCFPEEAEAGMDRQLNDLNLQYSTILRFWGIFVYTMIIIDVYNNYWQSRLVAMNMMYVLQHFCSKDPYMYTSLNKKNLRYNNKNNLVEINTRVNTMYCNGRSITDMTLINL